MKQIFSNPIFINRQRDASYTNRVGPTVVGSLFIKKVYVVATPQNQCGSNLCCGCINDGGDDSACCCDSR